MLSSQSGSFVQLDMAKDEADLFILTHSDNKLFSKVVLALGSLCKEIDFLCAEAKDKFYDAMTLYGEGLNDLNDEGEAASAITKLLETLQQIKGFSDHCGEVVVNTGTFQKLML